MKTFAALVVASLLAACATSGPVAEKTPEETCGRRYCPETDEEKMADEIERQKRGAVRKTIDTVEDIIFDSIRRSTR